MNYRDIRVGEYYYFDEEAAAEDRLHCLHSIGIAHIVRSGLDDGNTCGFHVNCYYIRADGNTNNLEDDEPDYFLYPEEITRPATKEEEKMFLLSSVK